MKSQPSLTFVFLIYAGAIGFPGGQSDSLGQCIDRRPLEVPMWQIYGINPYHPQSGPATIQVARVFSPIYQLAEPIQIEPQLGIVYPNSSVGTPVVIGEISRSMVRPDFENLEVPISISSPSDIVIAANTSDVPTLANASVTEAGATPDVERDTASAARLAEAEKEIVRLKGQLESAIEKARTAADRAYAAEKSAEATAKAAKRSLQEFGTESDELAQLKKQAEVEIQNRNQQIAALTRQFAEAKREFEKMKMSQIESQEKLTLELESLRRENEVLSTQSAKLVKEQLKADQVEMNRLRQRSAELAEELEATRVKLEDSKSVPTENVNQNPAKVRSTAGDNQASRGSRAQAAVDRLVAEAQEGASRSQAKPSAESKEAALNRMLEEESNKEVDSESKKKKRVKFNAEEQINKLNASMERQIEKSSQLINERGKARIEQLIKDGYEDSDPEVAKVRKKVESDLKENESRIRRRIDERIKRIRKEAEARQRS